MASYLFGDRIGREGQLALTTSVVIFDAVHEKILLTRRSDNGRWCLPGGHMEAGESISEACIREAWEETGLRIGLNKLIGIYSNPHILSTYPDNNRYHMVNICFEGEILAGEPGLSDETTEIGYFTPKEIARMDIVEPHHERIRDALAQDNAPIIH